jgi:uncharacterized damage-inducible protein DinB
VTIPITPFKFKKIFQFHFLTDIGLSLVQGFFVKQLKNIVRMETNSITSETLTQPALFISAEAFRDHWQGHRRLTRRVIEKFPEDKLFSYSVGGMRPFSELALEIITMGGPGIKGVVSGEWKSYEDSMGGFSKPKNKQELLRLWDEVTELIDTLWQQIPAQRFQEVDLAFGQYKGPIYWLILYFIDNEIHHRGQGFVYLRSLGIEPPPFWDRA